MADLWAGIPPDLRDKVEAYKLAYWQYRESWGTEGNFTATEAALVSALRELVWDKERLDWLESKVRHLPPAQGAPETWVAPTLLFRPNCSVRDAIDAARASTGETPE